MKGDISASSTHPHEPEIPPCLDNEGRCRICLLLVEIEKGKQWNKLLEMELNNLREILEAEGAK